MRFFMILAAGALVTSQSFAATAMTPVGGAAMPPPSSGQSCAWGSGIYSNGARVCVSKARLLVCINGEWRADETATPFTNDVCREDNPRAPAFGK